MLSGFNNNVVYNNQTYHVQTEDGGPTNPVITTFIYLKGAIVASRKNSYKDLIRDENPENTVRELMENQHKIMIKALLGGKLTK